MEKIWLQSYPQGVPAEIDIDHIPSLVALFEDQRAVVDILAPDVEVEDREGEPGSVLHDLVGKAGGHTFAAGLSVQVRGGHANGPHVGVLSEVIFHRHVNQERHDPRARDAVKRPPDAQVRTMPLVLPLVLIAFRAQASRPVQRSGRVPG